MSSSPAATATTTPTPGGANTNTNATSTSNNATPGTNTPKYTRIRKNIYEIQKRNIASLFDAEKKEYYRFDGIRQDAKTPQEALLELKRRPIIEVTGSSSKRSNASLQSDAYPVADEDQNSDNNNNDTSKTENYGWKWIGHDWTHEGADSWVYSSRTCSKGRIHVEDSKWSRSLSLFSRSKRRTHYRYAIKKNVTPEELQWLQKHHYEIVNTEQYSKFQNDLVQIKENMHQQFVDVQQKTLKPNILLLGGSGAGKSSLINAVFGKSLAEIGNGLPVTQTYKKFEDPNIDVVIYDSKGIEHGSIEEGFLEDTKQFFMKLRKQNDMVGHIHVVWYVIDLTQARFQPFEAEFCRNHLKDIPIIFVFNKADAVSEKTKQTMIQVVDSFKLKNCHGLFPTVAQCKNFDRKDCPKCGTTRIRKRVKQGTCTILCKECKERTEMHQTEGIDELSQATLSVLPNFVQDVFVNAQHSRAIFEEGNAKRIIREYALEASLSNEKELAKQLNRMASRLVKEVYNLPILEAEAKKLVQQRYNSYFHEANTLARVSILFKEWKIGNLVAPTLVLASGLEVCRNCIEFQREVARKSLEVDDADEELIAHEVLSQIHFEVDKKMINNILDEINRYEGNTRQRIDRYIKAITIDATPDAYYPSRREKKHVEEERQEIVLHAYQSKEREARRKKKEADAKKAGEEKKEEETVAAAGSSKTDEAKTSTTTTTTAEKKDAPAEQ